MDTNKAGDVGNHSYFGLRSVEFLNRRKQGLAALTKQEFVRGWCSLSFLFPGLHPDGFASRGSGWPKHFKPFASEAWRRFESGELTDNELYCYQASKARIRDERKEAERKWPWLFRDHFAV